MLDPCSRYAGPGLIWPRSPFPTAYFPRMQPRDLTDATRAWNFFEHVEAYDAAVRVNNTILISGAWYPLDTQQKLLTYKKGKALHQFLCPEYSWKSQRDFGITATPPTNVYPSESECPTPTGDLVGIGPC
jgi:hypothetical protein